MSRLLITMSVALNLFLLATMVAARVDVTRSRQAQAEAIDPRPALSPGAAAPRITSASSVADAYALLRSRGADLETAKTSLAAWLSGRRAELLRLEVHPYWERHDARSIEIRLARIELESAMRRSLVAIFGEGIAVDRRFSLLFEPLGPGLAFLATPEQVALQRAMLKRELAEAQARAPRSTLVCGSPERVARLRTAAPGALGKDILTPAAAFEYALRTAPQSEFLRSAELGLDEREFRQAFALLLELDTGMDLAAHITARRDLRDMLGERRFDRLWSRRDPMHALVREALAGRDLADSAIESAYSVVNRAQERLLELPEIAKGDERRLAALAREIADDEGRQLEELLGAEATTALQASRTRLALDMGRQRRSGC